jgi:hypothetical protein
LAPRARFELATLRLTVAALVFRTKCDDLLSCWFSAPVQAICSPTQLLPSAMVFDVRWAQNGAQGTQACHAHALCRLERGLIELLMVFIALLTHPQMTESGTLIIFGVSADAVVIAADSSPGAEKKIIRAGKFAACTMTGLVVVEGNTSKDGLDLRKLILAWIAKHPNTEVRDTKTLIATEILDALEKFNKTTGLHSTEPGDAISAFGCVGYEKGTPLVLWTTFFVSGSGIQKRDTDQIVQIGYFTALGRNGVCNALTEGYPLQMLSRFLNAAPVQKYRNALSAGARDKLTTEDFLALAEVCEEATESAEGRAFDPLAYQVAAPNHFAVIDRQNGFKWIGDNPPR